MTRRRWIADEAAGNRASLLGDNARHLAKVLRAKVGQEFEVSAEGRVRLGRVVLLGEDRVEFELGGEVPVLQAPPVVLLLAVFKFDRMEWAIEKATELGVERILPVIARRTEKHLGTAAEKRVERWRKIAAESAQQARRTNPPAIEAPAKLKDIFGFQAPCRIVLAESERGLLLRDALQTAGAPIALAVGPEGGWTDLELAEFTEAGWTAASLGPTILRAETAVVAALAITMAMMGSG